MAQILVRNLDEDTVNKLKNRAKMNGRSLQSEVKTILELVAVEPETLDRETAQKMLIEFQKKFKGKKLTDSVELIREERDR